MAKGLFQRRIVSILAIFLTLLSVLVIRLVDVQAVNASDYNSRVSSEMYREKTLLAPRGEITDINGVAFARSVSAINIVVDQTMIADPAKTAEIAAPILGMTISAVSQHLRKLKDRKLIETEREAKYFMNYLTKEYEKMLKPFFKILDENKILETI